MQHWMLIDCPSTPRYSASDTGAQTAAPHEKYITMAYATHTHSLSGNVFTAVSAFFAELTEAAERRRVYKSTYAELASLSARELSDIGLSKANIGAIAYEAAYK